MKFKYVFTHFYKFNQNNLTTDISYIFSYAAYVNVKFPQIQGEVRDLSKSTSKQTSALFVISPIDLFIHLLFKTEKNKGEKRLLAFCNVIDLVIVFVIKP